MAIVAILAGTIVPLAFREIVKAKEDATRNELDAIAAGLLRFCEDTGRFPSEREGLAALVADPGVDRWLGPYLGGGHGIPLDEIRKDEFGEDYAYDLDPRVRPAAAADVVVASKGSDYEFSSGDVNEVWSFGEPGNDILVMVTAAPSNRDKTFECNRELEAIAEAARAYFEHNARFPESVARLSGDYLDPGIDEDAFTDPWNRAYVLDVTGNHHQPQILTILSFGPNRQHDDGSRDDLSLEVSSVPPGRRSTVRRLDIAQTILNENPYLELTGRWGRDRNALGLADAYEDDGWGRNFGINVDSRTIFSTGPDGNANTITDNIPAGVGL